MIFSLDKESQEGIVAEKTDSMMNKIELDKYSKFPFCLVGQIISEFDNKKSTKTGVALLIGNSTILTAAHNLTDNSSGELIKTDSFSFFLSTDLYFKSISSSSDYYFKNQKYYKSDKYFIPDEFFKAIDDKNSDLQLQNDWALGFLNINMGDIVKKMFGLEDFSLLKISNGSKFFDFFTQYKTIEGLNKLIDNNSDVCIIGYNLESKVSGVKCSKNSEKKISTKRSQSSIKNGYKNDFSDIKININISSKEEGFTTENKEIDISLLDKNNNDNNINEEYFIINNSLETSKKDLKHHIIQSIGNIKSIESVLKYKISTFKGQSGSPIFLRLKTINDSNRNTTLSNEKNHFTFNEHVYIFIGIHSRRGPLLFENIIFDALKNEINFSSPNLKENLDFSKFESLNIISGNNFIKPINKDEFSLYKDNEVEEQKKIEILKFIALNGICEYNEGVLLIGDKISKMEKIMTDVKENSFYNEQIQYIGIKIFMNNKMKLFGIFSKETKIDTLLEFASQIIKIEKKYLILIILKRNSTKINGKYDSNKTIGAFVNDEYICNLEIDINMKYADDLGNNALDKYMDNYDISIDKIKLDFRKKHMKPLFESIFVEIAHLSDFNPTYGKLFDKMKQYILKKINLDVN